MALFLEIDEFTDLFDGTLNDAKTEQATLLLEVVDARIRELKADADATRAKQVCFEVVRDAVLYGELEKLSSFQNITSRRQEAGTFDDAARVVDDLLTKRHKAMLGAATRPAYYFGD